MVVARFAGWSRGIVGPLVPCLALAASPTIAAGQTGCPPFGLPNPLQAAVNAALPGDAIDVGANPNLGQIVCVTKPLLFFSTTTPPTAVTGTPGSSTNTPTGAFHIVPGVTGVVAFRNLQITGVNAFGAFLPGPDGVVRGVYSESSSATVVVDGCTVSGASYGPTSTGDNGQNGAAGIEGALARLVLKDSQVSGGAADFAGWSNAWNPSILCTDTCQAGSGGHAIAVTGEVFVVRCALAGGTGGDALAGLGCGCAPPPPSWAVAGSGGSAVVAPIVWSWASMGLGGTGGVVACGTSIYGWAPAGASLPPGGTSTLSAGPPPAIGGTAVLFLQNPFALPGAIGMSTTGIGPALPVPGTGPYVLGPNPVVFAAGPGLTAASVPIPVDPSLVGLALPVQGGVVTPGGGFQLTNPDLVLILP